MDDHMKYNVIPLVFLGVFTPLSYILVVLGNNELSFISDFPWILISLGSFFAWKVVLVFYSWAFLSLFLYTGRPFEGPPVVSNGYVPKYAANGTLYYLLSLITFAAYNYFVDPDLCLNIYSNFGSIVAVLNITALLLVGWLMMKGKSNPETQGDPLQDNLEGLSPPYIFYRGIELHPRAFGIDIKQWTNSRVGMLGWALLVISFTRANVQLNGFQPGPVVHAALILIYLFKFFYWETGYFNTLDITLDRAGYYLCWGCLVWVQCFYTFASYYMVSRPNLTASWLEAFPVLFFGLLAILFNYITDRQKEKFRQSKGKCFIWNRPAKKVDVEYVDHNGLRRRNTLLISGYWGIVRHLNYVFELLFALISTIPAYRGSILPFAYFFFLTVLLVHRTYRDDEKCAKKYGEGWKRYQAAVPYKMIPYVF